MTSTRITVAQRRRTTIAASRPSTIGSHVGRGAAGASPLAAIVRGSSWPAPRFFLKPQSAMAAPSRVLNQAARRPFARHGGIIGKSADVVVERFKGRRWTIVRLRRTPSLTDRAHDRTGATTPVQSLGEAGAWVRPAVVQVDGGTRPIRALVMRAASAWRCILHGPWGSNALESGRPTAGRHRGHLLVGLVRCPRKQQ
jgi:hypothetical protein